MPGRGLRFPPYFRGNHRKKSGSLTPACVLHTHRGPFAWPVRVLLTFAAYCAQETAIAQRILGIEGQRYWPSVDAVLNRLQRYQQDLDEKLETLTELPGGTAYVAAYGVKRRLPQIVRARNAAGMTFVLDDNNGSTVAEAEGVFGGLENGLRGVVDASAATVRVVRQAIGQMLEAQGYMRERVRLMVLVTQYPRHELVANLRIVNRRDPQCGPVRGIRTAHVYASRFPLELVGALECHAEHPRLKDALTISWLTDATRSGVGVAEALSVPATHEGEMVASALAELAARDVARRIGPDLRQSPTREQLMRTSVQHAVEQLQRAGALASSIMRSADAAPRVGHEDAWFDCLPGGMALLSVMHENAAWRSFHPPWTQQSAYCGGGHANRFNVLEAVGVATPLGIESLRRTVDALRSVRVRDDVSVDTLPFLAAQTLNLHPTTVALHRNRAVALTNPLEWQRAWAELVAHVAASHDAACRVSLLASGLALPPVHAAALLRECAAARPVLGIAARVSIEEAPEREQQWIRRMDSHLALVSDPPGAPRVQPGVPRLPAAHTLVDNAQAGGRMLLETRLATLRFDVEVLARERALDVEGDLVSRFSGVSVGGNEEGELRIARETSVYLCPFAGALATELGTTAMRQFEDMPVFLKHLSEPALVPAQPPPRVVVALQARTSTRTQTRRMHPLLVRLGPDAGATVAVEVHMVRMPAVKQQPDAPTEAVEQVDGTQAMPGLEEHPSVPQTLRLLWERVEQTRELPYAHGVGVDASSCFLYNVERVVQAILALAGHGHAAGTQVQLQPPPPPQWKRVRMELAPGEAPALVRARKNAWVAAVSLTAGGIDALAAMAFADSDAEATAWKRKLQSAPLSQPPSDNEREAYLTELLEPFNPKIETIRPELEAALRAALVSQDVADANNVSQLKELVKREQGALSADRSRPAVTGDENFEYTAQPPLTYDPNKKQVLVNQTSAYLSKWESVAAEAKKRLEDLVKANAPARRENERRQLEAAAARDHELSLWPVVPLVARAVASSIIASVPELVLAPGWASDAQWWQVTEEESRSAPDRARAAEANGWAKAAEFREAMTRCLDRGLVAVPLCELCAVVVRA